MNETASAAVQAAGRGRRSILGRVVELKGFSTLPVDELVVIDSDGRLHGELLGRIGADALTTAARPMMEGDARLQTVPVEIHGPQVKELGLACGGRADVLLQASDGIPDRFWEALSRRSPVALVTIIQGPGAGPAAVVVRRGGEAEGHLGGSPELVEAAVAEAESILGQGRTASKRVETDSGVALVEAWVPAPRLVVVGSGDVVGAIVAQAGLLGWEVRATESGELGELLDWAGATGALIVLSHDPHVDTPALAQALARDVPYVGAMGSRGTQSRRLERLGAMGLSDADLDRIHRPIGLNLGGRRASEVALAIVAEILACHCGRDARPLRDTDGPIHG